MAPLKLTPKVHKAIVESITNGAYIEPACRAAGVSKDSYDRWLARAEDPAETDRRFAAFAADIARADAEAENNLVGSIAVDEDWRAKAWVVGRRWKQRWSERIENTGADGMPQKIEVSLSDDDALAALRELAEAGLVQPAGASAPDPSG